MRSSLLVVALAACWHSSPAREARPHEPAPTTAAQVASRLTPDLALARIESTYRSGVQRCYQTRLKRDPNARGNVVVTFTVDDHGRVGERQAKGVHRSLELCVERAMMRWSFPPPAEQTTFRLALRLSSRT